MKYPEINNYTNVATLEGEVWKPVKGLEEYYEISNIGRVKRLERTQMNSNQVCSFPVTYPEMIMVATPDSKGYPQVVLRVGGEFVRVARVHRLVAEAFLEPASNDVIAEARLSDVDYVSVNHKDTDTMNPHVDNLEWCSTLYNAQYRADERDYSKTKGEACHANLLTEAQVLEIVELLKEKKLSQDKIAKLYGVKQITISNLWTGRSWAWLTGIPRKERSWNNRVNISARSSMDLEQEPSTLRVVGSNPTGRTI